MKLNFNNYGLLFESVSSLERIEYIRKNNIGYINSNPDGRKWMESLMLNKKFHKTYFVSQKTEDNARLIKFNESIHEWFDHLPDENGCFILNSGLCMRYNVTASKDISCAIYFNLWDDALQNIVETNLMWFNLPLVNSEIGPIQPDGDKYMGIIIMFTQLLLYKHYATIRLVNLKANQKAKIDPSKIVGESIKNDCPIPITYMDALWDRTIIVTGEINVTGHFRMQPYGPRENPRYELIWIDEFKKHGYVRRAGKLLDDEKTNRAKERSH